MHNDNDNDVTAFENRVQAYIAATRRLIDPGRSAMKDESPYVLTGGTAINVLQLMRGAEAASEFDADLIHLEFAGGGAMDGPVNVKAGLMRTANVVFIRQECRFWLDPRGKPALICRVGDRYATMTFDPDGMDSTPGKSKGSLERGYARADRLLRRYAEEALATLRAKAA